MGAADAEGVEKGAERPRQGGQVAGAHVLARAAVAGQVEGVDRVGLGQIRLVEQPGVEVAAEAVDQDDRRGLATPGSFTGAPIVEPPARGLDDLRLARGFRRRRGRGDGESRLEARHEGVDLGRLGRPGGDHAEQGADRHGLALGHQAPAQDAARGALQGVGDLGRLDVDDLVADPEARALLDVPVDHHALVHGEAPLGHGDRLQLDGHAPYPTTSRTAASILSGFGM